MDREVIKAKRKAQKRRKYAISEPKIVVTRTGFEPMMPP